MSAVHTLHTAARRLRRTSWLQLAGYAYLGLILLTFARYAAPAELAPVLRQLGLALPLALLAAKDLAHWPDALARLRTASGWRSRIAALLPLELLGMLRINRLMREGFVQWLRRRPPASRPEGIPLTYLQRGAYGTAVGAAMVSIFLELPIDVLIVDLLVEDPALRMAIRLVGAAGAVSTLVWVLGDRWHVADGAHGLADGALHLRVGVRTQGSIPLAAIERVDAITEQPERWRRRHGIHPADTLLVTPFDKPNCVMVLKPESAITLLHWQVRRPAPRYVLLYLDRPELLVRTIQHGAQ